MSTLGQISENFCKEDDEVSSKRELICDQCKCTFRSIKKVSKFPKCSPFNSPPPSFLRLA